jgi:hypothetical protein
MIDRLYKFIQTVSNNELNGNISPTEFKIELHNCVVERYEENIYELNRILNRERKAAGSSFSVENLTGKIKERILHYYVPTEITQANGICTLPEDLRYLDTVEINGKDAEGTMNRRHFKAVQNFQDTNPTEDYPIYFRLNNSIEVSPATNNAVSIYYLRNPKFANWTYALIPNPWDENIHVEAFDPDHPDFQDVDVHPSEEYNISMKLLQRLGLNLKEDQLTQYGLNKEGMDIQTESAN